MVIGERQHDRNLAIVLLAELTAILTRHANWVLSLLGESGGVNHDSSDQLVLLVSLESLFILRRAWILAQGKALEVREVRCAAELSASL
jgi:hypothetical protein